MYTFLCPLIFTLAPVLACEDCHEFYEDDGYGRRVLASYVVEHILDGPEFPRKIITIGNILIEDYSFHRYDGKTIEKQILTYRSYLTKINDGFEYNDMENAIDRACTILFEDYKEFIK